MIKLFRNGALNLLFSTSVAEEGLDIPECNIVVRYGLMTNEIAMMQVPAWAPSGCSTWPRGRTWGVRGGPAMSLLCRLQHLALLLQARGRARAENSVYFVLAKANSREVSRELLNEELVELMERAIRAVQAMPEQEYRLKVRAGRCPEHQEGQAAPASVCCLGTAPCALVLVSCSSLGMW